MGNLTGEVGLQPTGTTGKEGGCLVSPCFVACGRRAGQKSLTVTACTGKETLQGIWFYLKNLLKRVKVNIRLLKQRSIFMLPYALASYVLCKSL